MIVTVTLYVMLCFVEFWWIITFTTCFYVFFVLGHIPIENLSDMPVAFFSPKYTKSLQLFR
jgi:hypothetical protein